MDFKTSAGYLLIRSDLRKKRDNHAVSLHNFSGAAVDIDKKYCLNPRKSGG
jgi:hypothetical protein